MSLSMYQASAPVFTRMLTNLRAIVEKAVAHAGSKGIDPSVLVNSRLAPDMLPFSRQIQIATDMAKNCLSRLAGLEPPKFEDNETTFQELVARIDKTIAHVKSFKPAQIDGTEDKDIKLQMRTGPMEFKGQAYLLHFALPNFYFHVTTAYGLLRHNGLELGKMDFMGA
ncbi:MAG: DUF1993 domain-containing protein [Burkholderiaceae bacterium]